MKERTKETLRDGFGCLINNAAAMRGAKNGPLWLTIVMFILSIFLPVVPLFVSQANVKGSSFLSSYSYGLERYVTSMAMELKDEGYKFGVNENHLLSVSKDGNEINYADYGSKQPLKAYVDKTTGQYDFLLFVSESTSSSAQKAEYTAINSTYYAIGTTVVSETKDNAYLPSYMILFKNSVYVAIKYGTTAKANNPGGDYQTIKASDDYLATILTVKGKEGNEIAPSMYNARYYNGVYANFKTFLNKSYETLRIKNMFTTSGIYLGIFTGVCILMGFLMWLLTRGKNNPNNYFSIWLCEKIQARLGLAPALITLVVGFFLTNYAAMIYILTIGLRVMWISMKELRPVQQ